MSVSRFDEKSAPAGPLFAPLPNGRVSIHATTIAFGDRGLVLCGPSGAGKSGTAIQSLALGADLVADDLTVLWPDGPRLLAGGTPYAVPAIELRGLGLAAMPLRAEIEVAAIVWLGPSAKRLPDPETIEVLDRHVPLLRHPATADLAAKLLIWTKAKPIAIAPGSDDKAAWD